MGGLHRVTADLTPGKNAGSHCTRGWFGPAENLALTGIRTRDRPARSESLYRLSYPGPRRKVEEYFNPFPTSQ